MRYVVVWILAIVAVCNPVLAVTDTFTVSVSGGADVTPPTPSVLLSAVPIASTQIDIAWSPATDDVVVAGYVVLRDTVAIATTTLTAYSDTSLSASTTYSYAVYAFDFSFNISSTSNSIATTTLLAPVVPENTSREQGGSFPRVVGIDAVDVVATLRTARFYFESQVPTRYVLRWGTTQQYDAGYITSTQYRRSHSTTITGLTPGTLYYYELIPYDSVGRENKAITGSFTTLTYEEGDIPNVTNLTVTVDGVAARLLWRMPVTWPNAAVRIVRNHRGYPADPNDGEIVYEGRGTTFLDGMALATHGVQYYTVFVSGEDGLYASGAIVRAVRRQGVDSDTTDSIDATSTDTLPDIPAPSEVFQVPDIAIYQGSAQYSFGTGTISVLYTESLLIRIPVESVPAVLKSIIVTLFDPADMRQQYSFLLRLNTDKTAYEALLAPLGYAGRSQIRVEVIDFERQVVGRYTMPITFVAPTVPQQPTVVTNMPFWERGVLLGTFGLFLWVLIRLYRRVHPTPQT